MSVRNRVWVSVFVALLGLGAILYVGIRVLIVPRFAQLEIREVEEETSRLRSALENDTADLEITTTDYANWDDTYAYAAMPNEAFTDNNFTDASMAQIRVNLVMILDTDQRLLYAKTIGLEDGPAASLPGAVGPGTGIYERLSSQTGPSGHSAGLADTPAGAMMLAAKPIQTSSADGPAHGTIIFGRLLDEGEIAHLGDITNLDVASFAPDDVSLDPTLTAHLRSLPAAQILVQPVDRDRVQGWTVLHGIDGEPVLLTRVELGRGIFQEGLNAVGQFGLALALSVFVALALTLHLLEVLVIRNVTRLGEEIMRLGKGADPSARLDTNLGGRFSELAKTINEMLASLEQAQRSQHESRELLSNVLESIPVGIWVTDKDLRVRWWNRMQEQITGLPHASVLGKDLAEVAPGLVVDGLDEAYRQVVATGEPLQRHDVTFAGKAQGDAPAHLNVFASAVRDAGNEARGIVVAVEDITERRRAEQLQRVMYRIAEAASSCDTVEELGHRIRIELGQAFDTTNFYIAHYDPVQMTLCFPYIADQSLDPSVHAFPGKRHLAHGITEYLLRTGRPLLAQDAELVALSAAGEFDLLGPTAQAWLGVPLHDGERTVGVVAVQSYHNAHAYTADDLELLQYVSVQIGALVQRLHNEEVLRQQSAAMEAALDGMAINDIEWGLQYVNRAFAAMHGYDEPAQMVGLPWSALYPPEELERVGNEIGLAMQHDGFWHGEGTGRRRDGSIFPEDISLVALSQTNSVTIVRDLSEHKRLEEQFRQSQKMEAIGRLAGGVAHDFNNLLTAITGYVTFAQDALPEDDPSRQDLAEALTAADRAATLTRQLLAFSRRQIIQPRLVNLNDLIVNLDKMLRRLISENIALHTRPQTDLGTVRVDPGQVEQVIINLVINARDAMPTGGHLTIETSNVALDEEFSRRHAEVRPGNYVMLAVSDTGCGMDDNVKARLFEPFFTTKEVGKGTGLGLATCYGIVHQSGGHIWCYSERGRGSVFKIFFPRVENGQADRNTARVQPKPVAAAQRRTILVVEDEDSVRAITARVLRQAGYTVVEACNGQEALSLAEDEVLQIDLLVSDLVMPQLGGQELAQQLRVLRPGVKVLLVSGYTESSVFQQGKLDPEFAFLQKPFSQSALAAKVQEILM